MIELTAAEATALAELNEAQVAADKAAAIVKERKAELRKLGVGKYTINGKQVLNISGGASFDAQTAVEVLTVAEYDSILVPKPDADLAKLKLSGERYEQCQKSKALSVSPLR
jgi:hypothetical protein